MAGNNHFRVLRVFVISLFFVEPDEKLATFVPSCLSLDFGFLITLLLILQENTKVRKHEKIKSSTAKSAKFAEKV
jgi:hypothetical protein